MTGDVEGGWRPIETAPKDRSDILLWKDGAYVARWVQSETMGPVWLTPDGHVIFRPTHWLPLPLGPLSLPRGDDRESALQPRAVTSADRRVANIIGAQWGIITEHGRALIDAGEWDNHNLIEILVDHRRGYTALSEPRT